MRNYVIHQALSNKFSDVSWEESRKDSSKGLIHQYILPFQVIMYTVSKSFDIFSQTHRAS